MPRYDTECQQCGHQREIVKSVHDELDPKCEQCGESQVTIIIRPFNIMGATKFNKDGNIIGKRGVTVEKTDF